MEWTITPTEIRPSTPVLPAAAKGNVVEIPAVANATVYYKVLASKDENPGDPSTDTWTAYPDGGISLTKGHTYICAAAYANGQWSDVTEAVEYVYTLPVVDVSVNIHTGIATLSYTGTLPEDANPVILYTLAAASQTPSMKKASPSTSAATPPTVTPYRPSCSPGVAAPTTPNTSLAPAYAPRYESVHGQVPQKCGV